MKVMETEIKHYQLKNMAVCYYHVLYTFQSESTLNSCMNVKELLAQNRHDIGSLSNSNGIRTNNHLVQKRTLNHLAKTDLDCLGVCLQTKWLWVRIPLLSIFFFYNNVVHKIQTIFTTNKIKRNNYNKTWDYTNTIPITTRGSLGLNTK